MRHADKLKNVASAPLTNTGIEQAKCLGNRFQYIKDYFNPVILTSTLFRAMQTGYYFQQGMGTNEPIIYPINYFRERGSYEKQMSMAMLHNQVKDLPVKGFENNKSIYKDIDHKIINSIKKGKESINKTELNYHGIINIDDEKNDYKFRNDTMMKVCSKERKDCIKKKLEDILNLFRSRRLFNVIVSHGSLMRDIFKELSSNGSRCDHCEDYIWSFILPFTEYANSTYSFDEPILVFSGFKKLEQSCEPVLIELTSYSN